MSSVKCDSPISTEENKAVCLPERVECVCESVREDAAGLGGRPRQPKSSEKFADPTTPQAPNHSAPESHTCFSAAPLDHVRATYALASLPCANGRKYSKWNNKWERNVCQANIKSWEAL